MERRKLVFVAAVAAAVLHAGTAAAQVFTPAFYPPVSGGGVGGFLSGGIGPESGYALEATARRSQGAFDLGVRAGVADVDGAALLVGGEARVPFTVQDAPFDLAAIGAVQGIVGSGGGTGVAVGVTGGRAFPLEGVTVVPYAAPRLAISSRRDGLALLAELGAQVVLGTDLDFHVALGLGGETARLGFGILWR
jgi:hypothetical protein